MSYLWTEQKGSGSQVPRREYVLKGKDISGRITADGIYLLRRYQILVVHGLFRDTDTLGYNSSRACTEDTSLEFGYFFKAKPLHQMHIVEAWLETHGDKDKKTLEKAYNDHYKKKPSDLIWMPEYDPPNFDETQVFTPVEFTITRRKK